MRTVLRAAVHALERGSPVELVTVLSASGSTPRGPGAALAVLPDGSAAGTVGGGSVEFEAIQLARRLLSAGEHALRTFRFVQGEAAGLGMVCGGDLTLHFHHLSPDGPAVPVLRALLDASGQARDAWLVRRLEGDQVLLTALADRTQAPAGMPPELLERRAVLRDGWFALPVSRAGFTYIFGGGHVSQALVPAIAAVGFRPVVYDDRPQFAAPALFPQAHRVLCGPFEELSRRIHLTPDDDVVIMTRGHQADYEVLVQTLRSGVRYLGCIGSRKKLALCRQRLLEAGFTAEEYARVHAPIGLAIGAETPAEIAVSIAAELIAVRAGVALAKDRIP